MSYKHLFFDLDRTLWDYDANAKTSLTGLFYARELNKHYKSSEEFISIYTHHNDILWESYRKGQVKKDELRHQRFFLTLLEKGINNPTLADEMDEEYMEITPTLSTLKPHTMEILKYLSTKPYEMYILTNGFLATQEIKMKHSNLDPYFKKIYSSDACGYNKPNKEIFHWAVSSQNAKKEECLMIGDDLNVDIIGAKNYGIDGVWYNPESLKTEENITYEINDLIELKKIL